MIGWFQFLQLVLVLVAGGLTSWTDLKSGRIRNSHTASIACVGWIINGFFSFSHGLFIWWAAGISLSVLFSFLLWWKGLIPGGDAKLLMAMALAIPLWWYPSLAPGLFPFSVVVFVAFAILAVPVLISSARGVSEKRKGRGIGERVLSIKNFSELIPVAIIPSWVFVSVWFGWVKFAPVFASQVALIAVAVGFMCASFGAAEVAGLWRPPLWMGIIALVTLGSISLALGAHPLVLVLASAGAGLLLVCTDVARYLVESSTSQEIPSSDISVGAVVVGSADSEGLSRYDLDQMKRSGDSIRVWQEVRFAHVVFCAVLLVGVVHAVEVFVPSILGVEIAVAALVGRRW